uniref:Histonelysine Nmethyltransferase SETMARlike [Ceratitis capitata] n=1 Tax=Lepeophtheirus salmonis TaxID=72036 RepID=A0A0K2T5F7_LEPSM
MEIVDSNRHAINVLSTRKKTLMEFIVYSNLLS